MKKIFTFTVLLFIVTVRIFAVTASPYPVDFKQPDGNIVTVMVKGDERIHWHESMDGYTLLFNKEGYLTYAVLDEDGNLQPSDFIATDVEKRATAVVSFLNTIGKKMFYSKAQTQIMKQIWNIEDEVAEMHNSRGTQGVIGQYKTICAFVQFPEKSFIKTMNQFEPLFNQIGYTGNGVGSVRDFFKEASYNQFDLIITLCGFYTAPQSEAYYAGNNGNQRCNELARWVAQQVAAEPSINFVDYDSNNDGQVDGFHFIFAGIGQEAGGGSGTIWSHKWQFYPPVTKNGKSISIYSCSPELLWGEITTIGVICHEMSHAFGCADFYDTNYETGGQYDGTGNWDLMAQGCWNANGNRPSHHNPYVKIQYGWVTPTVLNTPVTINNMPNSAENSVVYRINTATNNEYYLLENRQKIKFDTEVPGSGLLIYHVHSNIGSSEINTTHPQKMYPVCASSNVAIPIAGAGNYGDINSAGCPFPTSNKTAFDGTSTPKMFRWTNTVISDKPITDITKNTALKTVSFKFMGGDGAPPMYTVTLISNPTNGGTVTGAGTYNENSSVTVTATPNTGFTFYNWTKSGAVVSTNPSYTFSVTQDVTLVANFRSNNANLNSLTVSSGTLTPTFSPNTTSYTVNVANSVTKISITGVAQDATATVSGNVSNALLNVGDNNFTITVTAQNNATKSYQVKVIRADMTHYTITASVENNTGGTISPEGTITVDENESLTFEMKPKNNYTIESVIVDETNSGTDNTYTFNNVTSNHTITVKFKLLTAIESIETTQIKISPNPADNHITIETDEILNNIVIFNMVGQKIFEKNNIKEKTYYIDINDFTSGIYYIRVNNTVRKLIKGGF